MAINNFEFPGVTLSQEFTSAPTSGTAVLGVVCIGPQYLWHTKDLNPYTVVVSGGVVSSGAAVMNPGNTASNTSALITGGGVVSAASIVEDGWFKYNDLDESWSGATILGGSAVYSAAITSCGDITNTSLGSGGLVIGDRLVVTNGAASGEYTVAKIVTVDNKPTVTIMPVSGGTITTGPVSSGGFLRHQTSMVASAGVTYTDTGSGLVAVVTPDSITLPKSAFISDTAEGSATLYGGTVYASCGMKVTGGSKSHVTARGSVDSTKNVYALLGPIRDDNPLAVAVYCAAAEAKGNTVYFQGVSDETSDAYATTVGKLEKYDDIYSIVLAMNIDSEAARPIVKAVEKLVVEESDDKESKVRRTLWYGVNDTLTDPDVTLIDTVISRRFTNTYRAQCVYADGITVNGNPVGNYAGAAAAAGMRSYEAVHRPLSNLPFTAFDSVADTKLSRADQRDIAKHGIWIIANNSEGTPVTLRQLTTAAANNINVDEESIIANADEIALTLCHVGEDKVGCSNIHPQLLMSLSDDITLNMDAKLLNKSGSIAVGPQLLSWELVELKQDPQALDHVYAVVGCEPPKPFNRFHITLRVL